MDENTLLKFIVDQVKSLRTAAADALPVTHPALITLSNAITELEGGTPAAPRIGFQAEPANHRAYVANYDGHDEDEDEDEAWEVEEYVRQIPEGMTEEQYDAFLAEQAEGGVSANATVVGNVPDGNGGYIAAGNAAESFAQANAAADAEIEEAAYEGEDLVVGNSITVEYTRLNEEELTERDVHFIVNDPISDALRHLGSIQLVQVRNTEQAHVKKAVFEVLEEGELRLNTLATGVAAYRGVVPFPRLGRIKAVATVDFE
jgi:hypothetical protein